jgi:hypothetical protein
MAYIGYQPSQLATAPFAVNTFTGDGSTTTFTLSQSVPGGNEAMIEVVLENVIQSPIDAYTVGGATSTSLVFSEAPISGGVIYVIHKGEGTYNLQPASGSVTSSSLDPVLRNFTVDTYTGNGSATTYTLTDTPYSANSIIVTVDGIVQTASTNYSVSGTTLSFGTEAPASGAKITVVHMGFSTGNKSVADGTITTVKLNSAGIAPIITGGTITGATFAAGAVGTPSITTTGDTNTGIYFPAADTIAFTEGGTEAMRINSSGNVGIGTTSPAQALDVVGSIKSSALTSGRVAYASTGGLLTDSANLTFNGTTLTANTIGAYTLSGTIAGGGNQINNVIIGTSTPLAGSFTTINASTSITNAGLTSGRVTYAGASGLLSDSTGFTFDGTYVNIGAGLASPNGLKFLANGGGLAASLNVNHSSGEIQNFATTNYFQTVYTNNTERMRIDTSGNLLVGTTSQIGSAGTHNLVSTTNNWALLVRNSTATAGKYWVASPNASNTYYVTNNSGVGVYITDGATSWTGTSDERLKNITGEITNGLTKVNSLRAVEFTWKADNTNKNQVGLIAQDIQKVLPESISENNDGHLGVRYTEVIPLLVAAIKELKAEFDAYKATHP